ncbi:hypothetical protein [Streptomyces sp. CBMA156]|uniref:hypothetical protein n=1 Tax=Streptomyces sp. CBMA156 TaxID=1930280 RepID=UPI001661F6D5|nr:hypothetical protein [Streptomyces sp. CBMA156]MBD0672621.1 hypothetical protein [Streptomyces sp. CBMA156]
MGNLIKNGQFDIPDAGDELQRIGSDKSYMISPWYLPVGGNVDVYNRKFGTGGHQAVDLNGDTKGGIGQEFTAETECDVSITWYAGTNRHDACKGKAPFRYVVHVLDNNGDEGVYVLLKGPGSNGGQVQKVIDDAEGDFTKNGPYTFKPKFQGSYKIEFISDVQGDCGAVITDVRVVQTPL